MLYIRRTIAIELQFNGQLHDVESDSADKENR